MSESARPAFASGLAYRDPRAALDWLERAFGFTTAMVVVNDDGSIGHSEMRFGDGLIYVGSEWDERHKSPASLGALNTQSIHVHLAADLDAHCARARAAGASIVREPADQFYGDRVYSAVDPEGHVWSFSQTLEVMSHEEMSAAGKVAVRERL